MENTELNELQFGTLMPTVVCTGSLFCFWSTVDLVPNVHAHELLLFLRNRLPQIL